MQLKDLLVEICNTSIVKETSQKEVIIKKVEQIEMSDPGMKRKDEKKNKLYIKEKENEIQNDNEMNSLNEEEKIRKSPYLNDKEESSTFLHCEH